MTTEILALDIVRGAYRLIGRPSQSDIRYKDVLQNASDVITGRLLDLKMSNRNHTAIVGAWHTPTAQIEDVSIYATDKMFIPVKAEWRYKNGNETQIPQQVEFCALETISENARIAREYVAIYDDQLKLQWSAPLTTLQTREYRIVYESFDFSNALSLAGSVTKLPSQFVTLCQYETASMTIHQVENDSEAWQMKKARLLETIMPMLAVWNERFETWRLSRFGNRLTYKKGFRPPSRRSRM
jgi:hypothetical protein